MGFVDFWRSLLTSGEPGEIEGRLRRFDGVYRWFLFVRLPRSTTMEGSSNGSETSTDIEDRKRAECLLARGNLTLEMTAKGNSSESILESLCRVVEQTASGCLCSVLLFVIKNEHGSHATVVARPLSRWRSRSARSTTLSTLNPIFAITTSPGADAPK
jgi:hypothetical protein